MSHTRILPAMKALFVLFSTVVMWAQGPTYRDPGIGKVVQIAIVCKDVDACSQRWSRLLSRYFSPRVRQSQFGQ
jgi:hypothetical protein